MSKIKIIYWNILSSLFLFKISGQVEKILSNLKISSLGLLLFIYCFVLSILLAFELKFLLYKYKDYKISYCNA